MAEEAVVGVLEVEEGVAGGDTLLTFQGIGRGTVETLEGPLVTVLAVRVSTRHTDARVHECRVFVVVHGELQGSGASVVAVGVVEVLVAGTLGTLLELGVLGQFTLGTVRHGTGEAGGGLEVVRRTGRTLFVRGVARSACEDLVASGLAAAGALLGVGRVAEETTGVFTALGGTQVLLGGVGETVRTLVDTEFRRSQ